MTHGTLFFQVTYSPIGCIQWNNLCSGETGAPKAVVESRLSPVKMCFSGNVLISIMVILCQCAADGRLGWPEAAPYDAIHVGAAAPQIPKPLLDQLKPGGRMVIPVGTFFQGLQVVDKNLDGTLSVRTETSVRYVPLTSADEQLRGF